MLEQVDFNTNFYNVMQVFHIDVFYCIHAHKAIDFIIYIYILLYYNDKSQRIVHVASVDYCVQLNKEKKIKEKCYLKNTLNYKHIP